MKDYCSGALTPKVVHLNPLFVHKSGVMNPLVKLYPRRSSRSVGQKGESTKDRQFCDFIVTLIESKIKISVEFRFIRKEKRS